MTETFAWNGSMKFVRDLISRNSNMPSRIICKIIYHTYYFRILSEFRSLFPLKKKNNISET